MHVTIQIFVVVLVVVVFVVSCNWFFPANHKSVSVLFLFTCILYCIAFLLLREAFLHMRIPSIIHTGFTLCITTILKVTNSLHYSIGSRILSLSYYILLVGRRRGGSCAGGVIDSCESSGSCHPS